MDALDTWHSR